MPIDPERLSQDAARLQDDRPQPSSTGTYAAVRAVLSTIATLRLAGITWAAIAEALAAQGLTQRAGTTTVPITGTRLSALVSDIKKKDERKARQAEQRQGRPDLAGPGSSKNSPSRKLTLARELSVKAPDATPSGATDSEEAIRRQQYDAVQSVLKPKQ